MMHAPGSFYCWALAWALGGAFAAAADQPPLFSATGLDGWTAESMMERKGTHYELTEDGGVKVLAAQCDDSASMEGWSGPVDLDKTPLLSWRWKVDRIYPGLDERVKDGSDFPARVYVVAGKRWLPWTLKSLIYVWSNGAYQAPSWPSPYATGVAGHRPSSCRAAQPAPMSRGRMAGRLSRDVRADFKQFYNARPQADRRGGGHERLRRFQGHRPPLRTATCGSRRRPGRCRK